jgi:hypothetical protein
MFMAFFLIAAALIFILVWTKLAKKAARSSLYLIFPFLMFSCHGAVDFDALNTGANIRIDYVLLPVTFILTAVCVVAYFTPTNLPKNRARAWFGVLLGAAVFFLVGFVLVVLFLEEIEDKIDRGTKNVVEQTSEGKIQR